MLEDGGVQRRRGVQYKCDKLRILIYYYIACVVRVRRGGEGGRLIVLCAEVLVQSR